MRESRLQQSTWDTTTAYGLLMAFSVSLFQNDVVIVPSESYKTRIQVSKSEQWKKKNPMINALVTEHNEAIEA